MALNNAIQNLLLRVSMDEEDAEAGLAKLSAALKAFGGLDEEAEAKVEIRRARKNLFQVNKELSEYAARIAEADANVNTREARAKLDLLERSLLEIDRSRVTAQTDVQIARSLAKIALLRREMSAFSHQSGVDLDLVVKEFAKLATTANRARTSLREGAAGPGPFEALSKNLRLARANIGPFIIGLGGLGRLWLLLIPKAFAFAAGIAAIASSAGAAVLGLGALAVAAAAVAAPLAILGIAAGAQFAAAKTGLDEYRTAMEALRQATRAQEDAERGLNQAQRDADDAQHALTRARQDARTAIAADVEAALGSQADAEHQLEVAQLAELSAQDALNQARVDAARALVDMRLAAEGAALGEKSAELNLRRARNELKALGDDAPRMKIKEARLAVQEAELALKDAREQNERSAEDLKDAEQRGVEGSPQVVTAREQVAEASYAAAQASDALREAIEDSAAAQKQTVRGDQSVIAARRALSSANRNVVDQERSLKEAIQETNKAQRQLNRAQRDAAPLLTQTGRQLRSALNDTKRALIDNLGPGVNRIWAALAEGLQEDLIPLLRRLRDDFAVLGGAIGDSIRKIFDAMSSPAATEFFETMIDGARQVVPLLTRGFLQVARIFGHIAEAALPFLIKGLKSTVGFFKGLADSTGNIPLLSLQIGGLVSQLGDWLKFFGAIIRAIFNLGGVIADDGQSLIQWLTDVVNGFADWAKSTEGQAQIQQFFDTMLPLFKGLLDLFAELVVLGINLAEIFGPIVIVINRVMTTLLNIINDILGAVSDLPEPVKLVIGAFLLWKGPIGVVRNLVGWIIRLGTALAAGGLRGAVAGFGAVLARIGGFVGGAIGSIGGLIGRIGGIGVALRAIPWVAATAAVLEYGDDLGKAAASFIGFSDASIKASEEHAAALGRLSDKISEISRIQRALKTTSKGAISTQEKFFEVFSSKQVDRAIGVLERGGNLAGKAWVQNLLKGARQEQAHSAAEFADIPQNLIQKLTSLNPRLKAVGVGLIDSVIRGINSMLPGIGSALKGIGSAATNALKNALGIHSPSRVFRGLGVEIGQGLVDGINSQRAKVGKTGASLFDAVPGSVTAKLVPAGGGVAAAGAGGGNVVNNNNFDMRAQVRGGKYPDADSYIAGVSRNLRRRGLSIL